MCIKYEITDENIEAGDICAYQDAKVEKRGKKIICVKFWILGTWDE